MKKRFHFLLAILATVLISSQLFSSSLDTYKQRKLFDAAMVVSNILMIDALYPPSHFDKGDFTIQFTPVYTKINSYEKNVKDYGGSGGTLGMSYGVNPFLGLFISGGFLHMSGKADYYHEVYDMSTSSTHDELLYEMDGSNTMISVNIGITFDPMGFMKYFMRKNPNYDETKGSADFGFSFPFLFGIVAKHYDSSYKLHDVSTDINYDVSTSGMTYGLYYGISLAYKFELLGIKMITSYFVKSLIYTDDPKVKIKNLNDGTTETDEFMVDTGFKWGIDIDIIPDDNWSFGVNIVSLSSNLFNIYDDFDLMMYTFTVKYKL